MNNRTVEVKVRIVEGDTFKGWDERPVLATLEVTEMELETGKVLVVVDPRVPDLLPIRLSVAVQIVASTIYYNQPSEVRWNFAGSPQGHYQFVH